MLDLGSWLLQLSFVHGCVVSFLVVSCGSFFGSFGFYGLYLFGRYFLSRLSSFFFWVCLVEIFSFHLTFSFSVFWFSSLGGLWLSEIFLSRFSTTETKFLHWFQKKFSLFFFCFVNKMLYHCFTPKKNQREKFPLRCWRASLRQRNGISLAEIFVSSWCIKLGFLSKRASFG